jgi:hypothetical protein
MDKPSAALRFSDSQLDQIFRAAAPLAPGDRAAFLEDVASALRGQPLGDGAVFRVTREVQRRYFHPPEIGSGPVGKYGRR